MMGENVVADRVNTLGLEQKLGLAEVQDELPDISMNLVGV